MDLEKEVLMPVLLHKRIYIYIYIKSLQLISCTMSAINSPFSCLLPQEGDLESQRTGGRSISVINNTASFESVVDCVDIFRKVRTR